MRNGHRLFLAAALLFAGAGAAAPGAQDRQPRVSAALPDVSALGPQPGEAVPDFSLPDQHGTRRTLASLTGPKGLILVFNRSVDW